MLLLESFREWRKHNAFELGAALAYYTVFSLAPVLVIVIAIAGLVFGRQAAQGEIVGQFRSLIGESGAQLLQTIIESASHPLSGTLATIGGIIGLVLGAGGAFGQLQSSLNRIWDIKNPTGGWRGMVKQRLLSFTLVLAIGFLLLTSLAVSAGLAAFGRIVHRMVPGLEIVMTVLDQLLSLAAIAIMFTIMFEVLPDKRLSWRDVAIGGVVAALLFTLGKALIGLYVAKTHVGSGYGVAGSVLVVLVWIYYSSQIVFFGAECAQVYAQRYGSIHRLAKVHGGDAAPVA